MLGKIYLFLTPSKTIGSVPSRNGPALTYWEVSQQTQTYIAGRFGCRYREKFCNC